MALSPLLPCQGVGEPVVAERISPSRVAGEFSGYPLATSNKPEYITTTSAETLALFSRVDRAGSALAGRFRVFFAHVNSTAEPLGLAIGLRNPGRHEAVLSLGSHTSFGSDNPGSNWPVAGASALASWLSGPREWRPLTYLSPVGPLAFPGVLRVRVEPGSYAVGCFDLAVRHQGGEAAAVEAGVVHFPASQAPPASWPPPAPPVSAAPGRGLFRHASRRMRVRYGASEGARFFDVAQTVRQQFGPTYPWDYETGYSELDQTDIVNNGNYGVDYQIAILAVNDTQRPVRLGQQVGSPNTYCEARAQAFALSLDGEAGWCQPGQGQPEAMGGYRWPFGELVLFPAQPGGEFLHTSTAAGSCSPARIYLLPQPLAPGVPWAGRAAGARGGSVV